MPDLGKENTFEQCVSEMALAGYTGSEVGNKYPRDTEVLKKALQLLHGGGQEHNWRSTTENLAGIAATSKALRLALDDDDFKRQKVRAMKQVILEELEKHRKVHVFSKVENFAPNILTFGIRGVRGEVVVHAFEQHEIYISTTSACSSKKNAAAGTLVAMNVPSKLATSAVYAAVQCFLLQALFSSLE